MRHLSKSKLVTYRLCQKRLWLEEHSDQADASAPSPAALRRMAVGNQIGSLAQRLYDPLGKGVEIDRRKEGVEKAIGRSSALLTASQPIFEAGFTTEGAYAFADLMLPVRKAGKRAWRMIEVKSGTKVENHHRDDAAIQAYIAGNARIPLASVAIAHIDSTWVYPGSEDYRGLLKEEDLTVEVLGRKAEVKSWIADAHKVLRKRTEPAVCTGKHCTDPWECGYLDYCQSQEPQARYPVGWLPNLRTNAVREHIQTNEVIDMRKVPDTFLNELQRRVKAHTLSGKSYFDAAGAAAALRKHKLPAYFLDFETIMLAIPIWKGTKPYEQIPFQFSVRRLSGTGELETDGFLDLSGDDPSKTCAEALIRTCGQRGPVFAYHASFEKARIKELAGRLPKFKRPLLALAERIVDLEPITRDHYYHPSQHGSWSIKQVLPAMVPELRYDQLDGVQDGGMAMEAYLTAIDPKTSHAEKAKIERQLREYCALDTYAMVRMWQVLASR